MKELVPFYTKCAKQRKKLEGTCTWLAQQFNDRCNNKHNLCFNDDTMVIKEK